MPDDDDELLKLAFQAEKHGDRIKAIRLYRQVASGGSEQSSYAQNCAETLEQLGLPAGAELQELESPGPDTLMSNSNHPFESPRFTAPGTGSGDSSSATARRLQITATIVRGISVFCVLASVFSFWLVTVDYGYLDQSETWNRFHVSACLDFLNSISLLVVAWLCWQYSTAVQQSLALPNGRIDTYSKRQLNLWIGVGVLAVLRIAHELSFFLPT